MNRLKLLIQAIICHSTNLKYLYFQLSTLPLIFPEKTQGCFGQDIHRWWGGNFTLTTEIEWYYEIYLLYTEGIIEKLQNYLSLFWLGSQGVTMECVWWWRDWNVDVLLCCNVQCIVMQANVILTVIQNYIYSKKC